MGLKNTCYALYRDRFLKILDRCGVVPRFLHLFKQYWDCLTMVAREVVYYSVPFKGYLVVMHIYTSDGSK